jgi:hypothetical protein
MITIACAFFARGMDCFIFFCFFGISFLIIAVALLGLFFYFCNRKFDVALASDLFAKDVAWRAENKIDSILDGPPLPEHRMGQLSTLVSCSYHGFDKVGRPLYIEKTGRIPVDGMLSYFTDAEMLHAHLWTNEFNAKRAKEGSERVGHVVDTFATILDLDGLTSSHKKLLDWAKHMTQIDQDHYPERLGFMAVINCPWYFPMFWAIVSSWIDPVTRAKFHILGSDYKEKLLELIDADQLPIEYGGTCDGSKCGKGANKPCLPVHDRDDAMKAFEVDESSMDIKEIVVKAGQKHEEVIKGQKYVHIMFLLKSPFLNVFDSTSAEALCIRGTSRLLRMIWKSLSILNPSLRSRRLTPLLWCIRADSPLGTFQYYCCTDLVLVW